MGRHKRLNHLGRHRGGGADTAVATSIATTYSPTSSRARPNAVRAKGKVVAALGFDREGEARAMFWQKRSRRMLSSGGMREH